MSIINAVVFGLVAFFWLTPVWRTLQMNHYRVPFYHTAEALDLLIETVGVVVAGLLCGIVSAKGARWIAWIACALLAAYRVVRFFRERTHVKLTKRLLRLALPASLVAAGAECAIALCLPAGIAEGVGLMILPLLYPYGCAVNALIRPLEEWNNRRYIRKGHERFLHHGGIRIGITGSFGKTSCKYILQTILSEKYRVAYSEGNRNTPLGLVQLSERLEGSEVVIAEMGARRRGDIRELCEMFRPEYGIITGVGEQHLESFSDIEEVYETKKELLNGLPFTGYAVLNGENLYTSRMAALSPVECDTVGFSSRFKLYASDIVTHGLSTEFTLCGWEENARIKIPLIGKHNVMNLLLCVSMAKRLGLTKEEVLRGIAAVRPIPHRLEPVENDRGIIIIDDSYNANREGVESALEVLSGMEGRKIIFTQGIVELGRKQREVNREIGNRIAQIADLVLLMGRNASAIRMGLREKGFEEEKIIRFRSLEEVRRFFAAELRPLDVVLIQNDIP